MKRVRLRSLAKINLDLRVLNKRADGYHELRTVFQTISLADTIEITYTPSRRLALEIESDPVIPGNLIEKAAEALGIPGLFGIRLRKRIPMGGGLGGGSSNAAAMLMAIPALTGKQVERKRLFEIAARLGSDVPFFLVGGTALGLGRGTELYPLAEFAARYAVLVAPGIHVSTAEAYAALGRTRAPELTATTELFDYTSARNDFEPVVFARHPELKAIKRKLKKSGADLALMSGSGSTLFGIFADRVARDRAAAGLRESFDSEQVIAVSLVSARQYRAMWQRLWQTDAAR